MKKVLLIALMAISMLSLSAAHEYVSTAFSAGFSNVNNGGTVGGSAAYHVLSKVNSEIALGVATKADMDILFKGTSRATSIGLMAGPAVEVSFSPTSALNFAAGLGLYTETSIGDDQYEFLGLGLGIDASYNYYFDNYRSSGIVIGATNYTSFMDYAELNSGIYADFSVYFGFAFNFSFDRYYHPHEHLDYYY